MKTSFTFLSEDRDREVEHVERPTLIAMNGCPASVSSTTVTDPAGPLGESATLHGPPER